MTRQDKYTMFPFFVFNLLAVNKFFTHIDKRINIKHRHPVQYTSLTNHKHPVVMKVNEENFVHQLKYLLFDE